MEQWKFRQVLFHWTLGTCIVHHTGSSWRKLIIIIIIVVTCTRAHNQDLPLTELFLDGFLFLCLAFTDRNPELPWRNQLIMEGLWLAGKDPRKSGPKIARSFVTHIYGKCTFLIMDSFKCLLNYYYLQLCKWTRQMKWSQQQSEMSSRAIILQVPRTSSFADFFSPNYRWVGHSLWLPLY